MAKGPHNLSNHSATPLSVGSFGFAENRSDTAHDASYIVLPHLLSNVDPLNNWFFRFVELANGWHILPMETIVDMGSCDGI